MPTDTAIGILGAGKLGITLAQLARRAGYTVFVATTGPPSDIALAVEVLAPGAVATTNTEAVKNADIIIFAFPLSKYQQVPQPELQDKLVIDATNHWWEVDGARDNILASSQSSSEMIQAFLPESQVVKALNHMGYHALHDHSTLPTAPGRKAIAVAGDSAAATARVAKFVDTLGFDPVYLGNLASGRALEPGGPVFGADVDALTLRTQLGLQPDTLSSE